MKAYGVAQVSIFIAKISIRLWRISSSCTILYYLDMGCGKLHLLKLHHIERSCLHINMTVLFL